MVHMASKTCPQGAGIHQFRNHSQNLPKFGIITSHMASIFFHCVRALSRPIEHHLSSFMIPTGILTISDRASSGAYEDLGGPALRSAVKALDWVVDAEGVVPDDKSRIADAIRSFIAQGCHLILTTGGTGIGPRDVTPEAIRDIMRVEIPGFGEAMRIKSFETLPNAILSRSLAAIVDNALVIALPGKPQGAVDCLHIIAAAVPHTVKVARKEPTSC